MTRYIHTKDFTNPLITNSYHCDCCHRKVKNESVFFVFRDAVCTVCACHSLAVLFQGQMQWNCDGDGKGVPIVSEAVYYWEEMQGV